MGRFLTTDPVVSDPYSGQAWNPYSYAANNPLTYVDHNPLTYVDPSGFSAVSVEASSPLYQIGVAGASVVKTIEQGNDEKLGEAAASVVVAIVAAVVTGRLAGVEAGAEAVETGAAKATGQRLNLVW